MDFEKTILSREELSALKALKAASTKKQLVFVEPNNQSVFERLVHFEFAEIQVCTTAPPGTTLKWPFPRTARITDSGLDYLAYADEKKREKRSERLHDVLLLIFSALIAVFFDHLYDILNFIRMIFEAFGKHQ